MIVRVPDSALEKVAVAPVPSATTPSNQFDDCFQLPLADPAQVPLAARVTSVAPVSGTMAASNLRSCRGGIHSHEGGGP